mgnify:CR=1 FL=1
MASISTTGNGCRRATDADQVFVPYKIKRLEDGELLASAQASGYHVEIEIFQNLCPGLAP